MKKSLRKLKKFFGMISLITADVWYEVVYCIQINMRYMAVIVDLSLPYCMYILGQNLAINRGSIAIGGEIFIPITCTIIVYYVKQFANKLGKGNTIPIPTERFTKVDNEGEVTVDTARLQELLLYTADLEDWLERKRWL